MASEHFWGWVGNSGVRWRPLNPAHLSPSPMWLSSLGHQWGKLSHTPHTPRNSLCRRKSILAGSGHSLELHTDWRGVCHETFPQPIIVSQGCHMLIGCSLSHVLLARCGAEEQLRRDYASGLRTPSSQCRPSRGGGQRISAYTGQLCCACGQSLQSSEPATVVPVLQIRKARLLRVTQICEALPSCMGPPLPLETSLRERHSGGQLGLSRWPVQLVTSL